MEDRFVYHPTKVGHVVGLGHDVDLTTSDGVRLHGIYATRVYAYWNLLFLHGSTGGLPRHRGILQFLMALGANVFALDYRGYGKSAGTPSEQGLYADAQAAYAWLSSQGSPQSVIVYGEGLGSGPACQLAATQTIGALVLLSAFTSLPELAATRYPWLPTSWIVRSKFDNLTKLANVRVPKLFVHSRADNRVPFELGEKLYDAAAGPKQSLWLEGAKHDEVYSVTGQQLAEGLAGFIGTLVAPS
ncbi:MAG TPA: alpha/beta hydrolase [Polyangiales bacterium]|nr:alpha/beta hydrolase [Polyangiales bacterium]